MIRLISSYEISGQIISVKLLHYFMEPQRISNFFRKGRDLFLSSRLYVCLNAIQDTKKEHHKLAF